MVTLPGIEEFVASGSGVVARLRLGLGRARRRRRRGDGRCVGRRAGRPAGAAERSLAFTQYDVVVQAVPVPGGGWAYLLDSSRRDGAQDAIRQSETGRRALVVCAAERVCSDPRTIIESGGTIRLG